MEKRVSPWLFAIVLATISCMGQGQAGGPKSAPEQYRVTVWIVRPVVKRMPTAEEVRHRMPDYGFLKLNESTSTCKDDNELLAKLRKQNPMITFDRIRFKDSQVVKSDELWTPNLPNGSQLAVKVNAADREVEARKLTRFLTGPSAARVHDEIRNGILIDLDASASSSYIPIVGMQPGPKSAATGVRMPWNPPNQGPSEVAVAGRAGSSGERLKGSRFVLPGRIYMLENGLGFSTSFFVKNPKTGKTGPVTKQSAKDIKLIRVEPILGLGK